MRARLSLALDPSSLYEDAFQVIRQTVLSRFPLPGSLHISQDSDTTLAHPDEPCVAYTTDPLIRKNPTRNPAFDFRGSKKFRSGYTEISVELTLK